MHKRCQTNNPILSNQDKALVEESLFKSALSRAQFLTIIYIFTFSIYGFTSIDFIRKFDPSISLLQNVVPRVILNSIPMLLLFCLLKYSRISNKAKNYTWAVVVPFVFMLACSINVWPILYNVNSDIYLFVHSANSFMFATSIIVLASSMRLLTVQFVSYLLFVFIPIGVMLYTKQRLDLIQLATSEYLIEFPFIFIVGGMIHNLRYKIALMDLQTKKQAQSFLGSHITEAIYNNKKELLQNRQVNAVVMQMDLRGFTEFYKKSDAQVVRKFMTEYHGLVSREIGGLGGYWHKSVGDAHIVTFGAINTESSGLDQLNIGDEDSVRKMFYFNKAYIAFNAICTEFENLKEKYQIKAPIAIGAGLSYGNLEVRIQGDSSFKQELDIDGEAIIRCARLEEYSKKIRNEIGTADSTICISPEFCNQTKIEELTEWVINSPDKSVRNYPDIKSLYYYRYNSASKIYLKVA